MKVILNQAVTGLGGAGTVKDVSDGYARNFLFPKGLAYPATKQKLKELENLQENRAQEIEEKKEKYQKILAGLSELKIAFSKKATKTGKLFAATTREAIAEVLSEKLKTKIDPEMVEIDQPIKSVGEHIVKLVFSEELMGEFKVVVNEE